MIVARAGVLGCRGAVGEAFEVDRGRYEGEVHGYVKQGAAYAYTRLLGYHPLLATRADTREALHVRLRKGSANTQRGMLRFCQELVARVDRAGATGEKLRTLTASARVR